MTVWCILCWFGTFSSFGITYRDKSGNPARKQLCAWHTQKHLFSFPCWQKGGIYKINKLTERNFFSGKKLVCGNFNICLSFVAIKTAQRTYFEMALPTNQSWHYVRAKVLGSRCGSAVKWWKWDDKWNREDPGLLPTRATSFFKRSKVRISARV
jgi:hypothetical protein